MISELTTRQLEIIESAGKILTNSGVSGLTIKNLAKEMEFSESAIYRHFKSKDQILVSMLEYLAENMDNRYREISLQKISPADKFQLYFQNQLSFFNENSHFVVAVFTDGLMEESKNINKAILNIMAVKMKYLIPVVAEAQKDGLFTNSIKTEEILHIVMGTFRLQMFKWKMTNFGFDLIENGNEILDAACSLIKTKKQ